MAWSKGTGSAFRNWLVQKLKQTSAASRPDPARTLAEQAMALGVQPDVLALAQRELAEETRAAGRRPTLKDVKKRQYYTLSMPKEVWEDWQKYCELRRLESSVLLRSLIVSLLSGPKQPTYTGLRWMYRGRRLTHEGSGEYRKAGKHWPYVARTELTQGAYRALRKRADSSRATPSGMVRGMILDLLEGRLKRLRIVTPDLWDDETKYWTLAE
jgi:hypothetical protein